MLRPTRTLCSGLSLIRLFERNSHTNSHFRWTIFANKESVWPRSSASRTRDAGDAGSFDALRVRAATSGNFRRAPFLYRGVHSHGRIVLEQLIVWVHS